MRVLFFGSRTWTDQVAIARVMDELILEGDGSLVVIAGGAPGADRLAEAEARRRGLLPIIERADWNRHGKAAGHIRNQAMIEKHWPELARGFRMPGKSNGTDDMVRRLKAAGIPGVIKHGGPA